MGKRWRRFAWWRRRVSENFLGNCSAIANYTDPEAVPTQLMPDLVEAYVLRGPEKAHAPLLEYQLLEIVQAAQLACKQRCEQVADGGMSNPPRPLASGRVEASSILNPGSDDPRSSIFPSPTPPLALARLLERGRSLVQSYSRLSGPPLNL